MNTVAFLLKAASLLPQLEQAGADIKQFWDWASTATNGDAPSQADVDALHAKENELRAALNAG